MGLKAQVGVESLGSGVAGPGVEGEVVAAAGAGEGFGIKEEALADTLAPGVLANA